MFWAHFEVMLMVFFIAFRHYVWERSTMTIIFGGSIQYYNWMKELLMKSSIKISQ